MGTMPPRDDEQRDRALGLANDKRLAKARLLRRVRAGEVTLGELIERRPPELSHLMLFEVALALPIFGPRRLKALNHRAIAAKVNLALKFGSASRETLDWLAAEVANAGVTAAAADASVNGAAPAKVKWPLQGIVGFYRTVNGVQRRLVLTVDEHGRPRLVDRDGTEERLVDQFGPEPGLLEVAAVATAYLADAREQQRPMVNG